MEILVGFTSTILRVLELTWWIFPPLILFPALLKIWVIYIQDRLIKSMDWVLLEIKVPNDILTTPKAMEQIFAAVYADYSHGINFFNTYVEALVDSWYSFEIVGYSGGVHFYLMTLRKRRNSMEAAIYAQYPGAEIHEAEDYTDLLPHVLPNESYDLWGTDLILARESPYPIRTYPYFEESVEERRVDSIAALTEVMSGLSGEQRLWLQIIVSPSDKKVGNNCQEEGEEIINKIVGRKVESKESWWGSWLTGLLEWFENLFRAPMELPIWADPLEKREPSLIKFLNPAEQEAVKAIDTKISKLGFETKIRFIFIDKREDFVSAPATAVMGTVRQFNTQNLNYFKPGKELTIIRGNLDNFIAKFIPLYGRLMIYSLKKKAFSNYKMRRLNGRMIGKYRASGDKIVTFNTEELATLYHFPIGAVGAPKLRRIESKKGEPPMTLPIENEEF